MAVILKNDLLSPSPYLLVKYKLDLNLRNKFSLNFFLRDLASGRAL